MTRTARLPDGWLVQRWAGPDLFAFARVELPPLQAVPATSSDWSSSLVAALGATWLLMRQPGVAQSRPLHQDAHAVGGLPTGRPAADRQVTIIDLRRAGSGRDSTPTADTTRVYQHRWIVRGHWRQQPCGPRHSQRRPVWVPAHLKGPGGAPMLDVEHVHVWRR